MSKKNRKIDSIVLKHVDDEQFLIIVNGKEVGNANHDDHGWSGMDELEKMMVRIGKVVGVEVEEVYPDYTEES